MNDKNGRPFASLRGNPEAHEAASAAVKKCNKQFIEAICEAERQV